MWLTIKGEEKGEEKGEKEKALNRKKKVSRTEKMRSMKSMMFLPLIFCFLCMTYFDVDTSHHIMLEYSSLLLPFLSSLTLILLIRSVPFSSSQSLSIFTGNEEGQVTEGDEAVTQKAMDSAKHFGSKYDTYSCILNHFCSLHDRCWSYFSIISSLLFISVWKAVVLFMYDDLIRDQEGSNV